MNIIYKVYVKLDNNNCIELIDSTAYYTEQDLIKMGYVYLDEGTDTDIYGNAQINYFEKKFGKKTLDENSKSNFRFLNGKAVKLSTLEKEDLFKPQPPQASEQDRINADLYLQIALLQNQGFSTMLLSEAHTRYDQIKKYYDLGLYTSEMLDVFVSAKWISEFEKNQIMTE